MKISKPQYSYALNSDGELIHIRDVDKNNDYFCPICGTSMIPHTGKVRKWHFEHKNNIICNYESYLHQLAKKKIRDTFLSSEHFFLSYDGAIPTCSANCPYPNIPRCTFYNEEVRYDLKEFYDICEIEASYKNFVADLILKSSIHPRRPPILIEIFVTHKCSKEKIDDGVRIIEIPIKSEKCIENIIAGNTIIGTICKNNYSNIKSTTLYNFKANKTIPYDPRPQYADDEDAWNGAFSRKDTVVFCLDSTGFIRLFDCCCYEVLEKIPPRTHYFVSNIRCSYKDILKGFSNRGVKTKTCFLCKFSKQDFDGNRICVLYKKFNLPRKPNPSSALICKHYREDNDVTDIAVDSQTYDFKFHYYICKDILQ